jgi:hypothetical protein
MNVASLRRRLVAALVDAAVAVGGIVALVAAAVAGAVAYGRVRGHEDEQDGNAQTGPADFGTTRVFRQPPQLQAALSGASAGLVIGARNHRSPGFRVAGLRRVDAQTGGIVSVRSALVGLLFDRARQAATRPLFASRAQRQRDRIDALGPKLRAVEREYAGDPEARQRAVMEFYKTNDVNPLAGCGWQLAGPFVANVIFAAGSRGGRTLRDRITGTAVIADR